MGTDLAKAVILLGEIVKTLQAYASVSGGGSLAPLPVPSAPVETPTDRKQGGKLTAGKIS